MCTFCITPGWAENTQQNELTLNQAIELTLQNSEVLRKSALDIKKAEENRKEAADNVDYIPAGMIGQPSAEAAWYSLLAQDLTWRMSKKSYGLVEDRIVLDVCQKYWNVQNSLNAVKSKEKAVTLAEIALQRAQIMVNLGMTPSEYSIMSPKGALTAAQSALVSAKSDLENAKNKVNSDYEALNNLIGLDAKARPILIDNIDYVALPETDLDSAVRKVINDSPSIWLAEEKIKLAQYAYQMMWATGSYTPYEVRKIEKEQAEIDAVTAKNALDLATRGLYYTVRNLEAAMPALEEAVAVAEESVRVAKLQYELGMITKENVVKAELALEEAKSRLLNLKQQHAYAKLAFQKPWAVSTMLS